MTFAKEICFVVCHAADLVQAMTLKVTGFEESGDDEDDGGLKAVWRMQPVDNSNSDASQQLKMTFDVTQELDWRLRRQSLQVGQDHKASYDMLL